jgi:N-acetylglucosamine kinase-like BadF-type ATPase
VSSIWAVDTTGEDQADSSASPALVAVDGGATKTDVVLVAVDGTVLGQARGPASNHQMVGLDAAVANIAATITEALSDARGCAQRGAERTDAPVAPLGVYCLAGVDLDVDERRVGEAVAGAGWTGHCDVRNDTFAVLRAGATSPFGVGVVCGTGLNCVGVGPDDRRVRYPSLGELSGDFTPGGAWLGIRGLGLALRAGDGRGDPTTLRRLVADHLGLPTPESVLEATYAGDLPFGRLMELARVVLEAADDGDGPSRGAVDQLVAEVVAMAAAAIVRLGLSDTAVEVVVGGGIFENARFAGLVLDGVRFHAPGAVLRPLAGRRPVLGAALLGLDAMGAGPAAEARLRSALAAAE